MNHDQLLREHQAATDSCGWRSLDGWDTLRVTGVDRATFLHNMCTNDIRGLAAGQGCEAFFTDVKGKIVAHALVFVDEAAIVLAMVPGSASRLSAHLDRYIIREDVQLSDATAEYAWMVVAGRQALAALTSSCEFTLVELAAPWSHVQPGLKAAPDQVCRIVRCDLPWPGGALVQIDRERTTNNSNAFRILGKSGSELTEDLWHAIRIESAWPLWGVDFDETNLPQEVNRDHLAIHFQKGCYLGQETVARIDALGHVNKKLVQVRFSGDVVPEIGATLTSDGQEAGRVTSVAWSPKFQAPLALAMVRRQFSTAGAALTAGSTQCEVLSNA